MGDEVARASNRLTAAFARLEKLVERQCRQQQRMRRARHMVDDSIKQVEMLLEAEAEAEAEAKEEQPDERR